jgi:hypothetical protein
MSAGSSMRPSDIQELSGNIVPACEALIYITQIQYSCYKGRRNPACISASAGLILSNTPLKHRTAGFRHSPTTMKFTSVLLFAFLGLLTAVAALPLSAIDAHDGGAPKALEERFVDENDPIFARYFGPTSELIISERDYADDIQVERRQYVKAAEYIVKGIVKIVELIKGKIEQDKKVRSSIML